MCKYAYLKESFYSQHLPLELLHILLLFSVFFFQIYLYRVWTVLPWHPVIAYLQHACNKTAFTSTWCNLIRSLLYYAKVQYQEHISVDNAENQIQLEYFKICKDKCIKHKNGNATIWVGLKYGICKTMNTNAIVYGENLYTMKKW